MKTESFLICIVITAIGYLIIDIGYHTHSHMVHHLLTGIGGGILVTIGIIIKTMDKEE